jgi:hypothetical protein
VEAKFTRSFECNPNAREAWIAIRGELKGYLICKGNNFKTSLPEPELSARIQRVIDQKFKPFREALGKMTDDEEKEEEEICTASTLLSKNLEELRDIARASGKRGWSKLRKRALVEFILN